MEFLGWNVDFDNWLLSVIHIENRGFGEPILRTQSLLVLIAVTYAAGCSAPTITVMDRKSGELGTGQVENTSFGSSGPITIQFESEVYRGTWVAVQDPGSTNFILLNAYGANGGMASGTASGFSSSTGGFGTDLLRSGEGNSLRCEVRYSSMTITAAGVCRRQDGAIFDLQMS